jgi:Putative lactococcus lactis phage r1t holin
MGTLWTWYFWKRAIERLIKTFAQSLAAVWGAGGVGILDVPWLDGVYVALAAAAISVLTSIGSIGTGDPNGPSLIAPLPAAAPAPPAGDLAHH